MEEAVRIVRDTLETDLGALLERAPSGDFFHRRIVSGALVDGPATVSGFTSALAVYAIRSGASVVSRDVRTDARFECPPVLQAEGAVSGICVVVRVPDAGDDAYGVLSVFDREPRDFVDDDVHFMEAVAAVIGATIVRCHVEQRLTESEERFDMMANAIVDGAMFPLSADGTITGWNAPAVRLYGLRAEETVGRHFSCLFTEADVRHGVPDQLVREAESGGGTENEGRFVRRDGSTFRASIWFFALRGERGTNGFAVVARDETARDAAEAERARLRAEIEHERLMMQAVIDQMPAGVVIADASGGVLYANSAFRAIWRRPIEVPISARDILARFPVRHEGGALLTLDEYSGVRALRGESSRQVLECQRGDGTWCAVLDTGAPVRDASGRVLAGVAVVVDIHAQREAERERERLLDETRRAVATRDHVLAVVSHDLRNPLNAITLAAEQISRMPDWDQARAAAGAARIRSAANRMDAILADLADVSRIQGGRLVLDLGDHDGIALVLEAADMFAEIAASRHVALRTAAEPLGAPVRCDRHRILQVLSNLIGNALKFVTPPARVEIGCARRGRRSVFFVRDDGPGLRADDVPHVFDRYWQGETAPSQKKQGLGLGLTICKEIVDAHGGRIWVDSELGRGATFSFELPLSTAR